MKNFEPSDNFHHSEDSAKEEQIRGTRGQGDRGTGGQGSREQVAVSCLSITLVFTWFLGYSYWQPEWLLQSF
jgi:hypothetical protein